jgi:myo-inositol-1(or 4)-monophosphatase
MNTDKYLAFAKRLALDAGKLLLKMSSNFGDIKYKTNSGNLVTAADKASEKLIVNAISKKYPSHCIMAEESGDCGQKDGDFQWLIDPLDGTTNYAHQLPIWAVSIALAYQRNVIVGVVYQPSMNALYYAALGKGAFCNRNPIKVSHITEISKSLMVTGIPYSTKEDPKDNFLNFQKFSYSSQAVRRLGSAAIDFCYTASGKFDGYWERNLNPWDVAAGSLILTEAGGTVTDFRGKPYQVYSPDETLASNGKIHQAMIKIMNRN